MPSLPIIYNDKKLTVHKTIKKPDFSSRTILVSDSWEYVEMWLKRKRESDALIYWQQARNFFEATERLPKTSSPLTAYYCFLNATKALLLVKKMTFGDQHGVAGSTSKGKVSLAREKVIFQTGGILASMCNYLNEAVVTTQTYTLKDLLYNLPYVHRAYNLTFTSRPELFIPISNPILVRKDGSYESWFYSEITDARFRNNKIISVLEPEFEYDAGIVDKFVVRRKRRFRWEDGKSNITRNLTQLINYHESLRSHLYYIYGPTRLWYIKRVKPVDGLIPRSSMTIAFAVMHRLSELARYSPISLTRHFESMHNWVLSEFISKSLYQYIDEISSEITGQEFLPPGIRF